MKKNNLEIDWRDIALDDNFERSLNIIEPLSFSTLLLEIKCNIKEINCVTIREQFAADLQKRAKEAWEVFDANLINIEQTAKRERE